MGEIYGAAAGAPVWVEGVNLSNGQEIGANDIGYLTEVLNEQVRKSVNGGDKGFDYIRITAETSVYNSQHILLKQSEFNVTPAARSYIRTFLNTCGEIAASYDASQAGLFAVQSKRLNRYSKNMVAAVLGDGLETIQLITEPNAANSYKLAEAAIYSTQIFHRLVRSRGWLHVDDVLGRNLRLLAESYRVAKELG